MKKILGILICMLLIATTTPVVTSEKNTIISSNVQNTQQLSMTGNWTEIQKLLASDGETEDYFGYSVSISGDTALVGAYYDDDIAINSGSVYVFIYSGTTWTQQAKLHALDGAQNDYFGNAVSVDGDTALIGAYQDDNENGGNSGAAYVFVRTGSTWTEQAKLLASDGAAYDGFATAVSLDGDTALIGTPLDDDSAEGAGSAYVFIRTDSTWVQQQKIVAPDPGLEDLFGCSVSLCSDTALIGAPEDDENGDYSGSAYVFTRTGTAWFYQAKLIALDNATGDRFGISVSLSADTVLIGAQFKDAGTGAAYVFIRTGVTWTEQAKLLASDGESGDNFGSSISLDGDTALIGAPCDDGSKGFAYVFTRLGNTWMQQEKLLASDGEAYDLFGWTVSLDDDVAIIGAWGDDSHRGAAYVFTKEENHPPDKPDQPSGETNGKINTEYSYTTKTTDIDGDQVYYNWSWGDGSYSGWLGPSASNTTHTARHTWTTKGSYSIKVKAKDPSGNESGWSDPLPVTMPYSYRIPLQWFWERLFQRFPNAFPILRYLLGL